MILEITLMIASIACGVTTLIGLKLTIDQKKEVVGLGQTNRLMDRIARSDMYSGDSNNDFRIFAITIRLLECTEHMSDLEIDSCARTESNKVRIEEINNISDKLIPELSKYLSFCMKRRYDDKTRESVSVLFGAYSSIFNRFVNWKVDSNVLDTVYFAMMLSRIGLSTFDSDSYDDSIPLEDFARLEDLARVKEFRDRFYDSKKSNLYIKSVWEGGHA